MALLNVMLAVFRLEVDLETINYVDIAESSLFL